jgi:hypothetical protein
VLNVRRIVRWSVVSELADAASGMLGAGGELDDAALADAASGMFGAGRELDDEAAVFLMRTRRGGFVSTVFRRGG